MDTYQLAGDGEDYGSYRGRLPRVGDQITVIKGNGGVMLYVIGVEHTCDFGSGETSVLVRASHRPPAGTL